MNKKWFKRILWLLVGLGYAGCLFYCLVAGAPLEKEKTTIYLIAAAGFSGFNTCMVLYGIKCMIHKNKRLS